MFCSQPATIPSDARPVFAPTIQPPRSASKEPGKRPAHGRAAWLTTMGNRLVPAGLLLFGYPPACIVTTEEDSITEGAIRSLVTADKLWDAPNWLLIRRSGTEHSADPQGMFRPHRHSAGRAAEQVARELALLQAHPLVGRHIRIRGFVLDTITGRFREVPGPGGRWEG